MVLYCTCALIVNFDTLLSFTDNAKFSLRSWRNFRAWELITFQTREGERKPHAARRTGRSPIEIREFSLAALPLAKILRWRSLRGARNPASCAGYATFYVHNKCSLISLRPRPHVSVFVSKRKFIFFGLAFRPPYPVKTVAENASFQKRSP